MVTVLHQRPPFKFSMKSGLVDLRTAPKPNQGSEKGQIKPKHTKQWPIVVPPIVLLLFQAMETCFHCFHILYCVARMKTLYL